MGDSIDAPHMKKARELILSLGGAERCNTYSKFYLAALGQMHYDSIPVIPPEVVLLAEMVLFSSGQSIGLVAHHDHAAGCGFELPARPPAARAEGYHGAVRQPRLCAPTVH